MTLPIIEPLLDIAVAAGAAILKFAAPFHTVTTKTDRSPVTEADEAAEAIICAALRRLCPGIPIVAEEEAARGVVVAPGSGAFFLVDPLDGTKEFIAGRADYTVNIALVEEGVPCLGVVYAPARGTLYYGSVAGAGQAEVRDGLIVARSTIAVRQRPLRPTVVGSRSHPSAEGDAYVRSLGTCDTVSIGSSLKFCLIAAGEADIYPRFGRTMEWDTAAGHAVLLAAGGKVRDLGGLALRYGKHWQPDDAPFANPPFIASGAD